MKKKKIKRSSLPEGVKIYTGPRGGQYILDGDTKIYIVDKEYKYRKSFKPRPGAFKRSLDSQLSFDK